MRLSARRSDDADVIRSRLRVLLAENGSRSGWLPGDDLHRDAAPAPDGDADADLADPAADHGTSSGRYGGHPAAVVSGPTEEQAADEAPLDASLPYAIGRHRAPGTAVRLDPGRRGAWSLWAAGLVAAVLLTLWTWWDRPRLAPVTEQPSSTVAPAAPAPASATSSGTTAEAPASVVVSVVGLVARPGLVTLPSGSRVADALAAAGGPLPEADPSSVNLAAVVTDGEQIAVGVPGAAAGASPAPPSGTADGRVLDLNAATASELDTLPGIGPVLAQRIVDQRDRQGRFGSVEQLQDVPGIGPAIYAGLVDLVTV